MIGNRISQGINSCVTDGRSLNTVSFLDSTAQNQSRFLSPAPDASTCDARPPHLSSYSLMRHSPSGLLSFPLHSLFLTILPLIASSSTYASPSSFSELLSFFQGKNKNLDGLMENSVDRVFEAGLSRRIERIILPFQRQK